MIEYTPVFFIAKARPMGMNRENKVCLDEPLVRRGHSNLSSTTKVNSCMFR